MNRFLPYLCFFSQKRQGKRNSSTAYSGSYVRCLHEGADICWRDQISAQISADICADICRYLADICSKARLTMQSIYSCLCCRLSCRCHHRCTIVRRRPAPPPPSKPPSRPDPTLQSNKTRHIIMNPPMPSAAARRLRAPWQPTALVAFVVTASLLAAAAAASLSGTVVAPSPSPHGASPSFFGGAGGLRCRHSRSCSWRYCRRDGG